MRRHPDAEPAREQGRPGRFILYIGARMPEGRAVVGELASTAAAATWAVGSLLFARAGERVSASVLNLAKCGIGLAMLVLTAVLLTGSGWPQGATAGQWAWLGLSGVLGLSVGDTAFFGALLRLGPRRALLLWALVPPLTAVLGWMFLGEPLTFEMLLGIVVTTAGVTWVVIERSPGLVVRPKHLWAGVLLGVVASTCQAVGSIMVKQADHDLSALDVSILRLVAGTLALVAQVAVERKGPEVRRMVDDRKLGANVAVATFVGTYLGIWLSIYGLQNTYAGVAATLQSTSPIFVLPLAVFVLKERLTARAVIGALVAVGGVAVLVS
jgi:drug/metabolite transporter (DMT)-like permease